MKKFIAIILAALMVASLSVSALGAATISFEDQNTYGKANAASKYYRRCKIVADSDTVKFGKYSGKIFTKAYYWTGDDDVEAGYVDEFYIRLNIKSLGVNDGDLVDFWFYLPEDCNIDTVNIKAYDQNEDEVLTIDTFTNDEEGTWTSLSEYWGGTLDSQANDDINTAAYLCFYGKVQDPEKDAVFYVDNIFFGNESEHEQYVSNPDAFVTVTADDNGGAEATEAPAEQTGDAAATVPAADDKAQEGQQSGSFDTDTIIMCSAIAVAVVVAVVAVIVIIKKKK